MIAEQKHTPGPWHFVRQEGYFPRVYLGGNFPSKTDLHGPYIIVNGCEPAADMDVHEANGRLIAAAPELLASLRDAHDHLEHMAKFIADQRLGYSFESLGEDIGNIREAIAKAEGRS